MRACVERHQTIADGIINWDGNLFSVYDYLLHTRHYFPGTRLRKMFQNLFVSVLPELISNAKVRWNNKGPPYITSPTARRTDTTCSDNVCYVFLTVLSVH